MTAVCSLSLCFKGTQHCQIRKTLATEFQVYSSFSSVELLRTHRNCGRYWISSFDQEYLWSIICLKFVNKLAKAFFIYCKSHVQPLCTICKWVKIFRSEFRSPTVLGLILLSVYPCSAGLSLLPYGRLPVLGPVLSHPDQMALPLSPFIPLSLLNQISFLQPAGQLVCCYHHSADRQGHHKAGKS